jgi:hypothetical protein
LELAGLAEAAHIAAAASVIVLELSCHTDNLEDCSSA